MTDGLTPDQMRARAVRDTLWHRYHMADPKERLETRDRLIQEITSQRMGGLVTAAQVRKWFANLGVWR